MYQRQVSFGEAISMAFNKYCCFTGRASRSEYWWWVLFTFIISVFFNAFFFATGSDAVSVLSSLVSLALFLPGLGLCVRRLHDISKSGWWLFLAFIPLVGAIILIIWFCKESDPDVNQYGGVPNLVA